MTLLPDTPLRPATMATELARRGWLPVPVASGGKSPTMEGVSGWAQRPLSFEELDVLDGDYSACRANIGVVLPVGVIGLDVDSYDGKPGGATLESLVGQLGALPPTYLVTARDLPSGVRPYQVPSLPDGERLVFSGTAGDGIDVIQNHHRNVTIGRHHTGTDRRIIDPDGELVDTLPHVDELPWLPQEWVEHLRIHKIEDTVPEPGKVADPHTGPLPAEVQRVRDDYTRKLAKGSRHDTALTYVRILEGYRQRGWPGADEALEEAARRYEIALNGDRENDFDKIREYCARSVATQGCRQPWYVEADFVEADGPSDERLTPFDLLGGQPIDFKRLFTEEPRGEDWLIPYLVSRSRLHALFAAGGTGKSLVSIDAILSAVLGRGAWGQPAEPISVLYLDYEMGFDDMQERIIDMGYTIDDAEELQKRLHIVSFSTLTALDRDRDGHALVLAAVELGVDLVVIDTMSRAVEGEENSADTYRAFFSNTGMRLKAKGIAMLRLDHAGKDISKGQRGASAKNDDVDIVWQLKRTDDGYELKCTKGRMQWIPERVVLKELSDRSGYRYDPGGATYAKGTKELAALLDDLDVPATATVNAAAKALRDSGHGKRKQSVTDAQRWRKAELPKYTIGPANAA